MMPHVITEGSLQGRLWRLHGGEAADSASWLERILRGRGLAGAPEIFLRPPLRQGPGNPWGLPSPYVLTDMRQAAAITAMAIREGRRIGVLGDYDADGITATAILMRYLRARARRHGAPPPVFHIPDRLREGYGVSWPGLARLREKGAELVICVDSGSVAHEALGRAEAEGLDVIVVDHHGCRPDAPPCRAFVNPHRHDETERGRALRDMCAAGLSLLFVQTINAQLDAEIGIASLLDLAALGTVADVMPLAGGNRALVQVGLRVLAGRGNAGLAALIDEAGLSPPFTARHLAWVLGPRLNAAGRIGDATEAVRLLITEDPLEAQELARRLEEYNAERKRLCERAEQEAFATLDNASTLVVVAGDWHPGIVGIIAGRLCEELERPAVVIGRGGKGSARSVPGFDIGQALRRAQEDGLLKAGGGHAGAGGLTLAEGVAADELRDHLAVQLQAVSLPRPALDLDLLVPATAVSPEAVHRLDGLEPCGEGNPPARLAVRGTIQGARLLKDRHLKLDLDGLDCLCWNAAGTALAPLLEAAGRSVLLAGEARMDEFNGRKRAQLFIDDAVWR